MEERGSVERSDMFQGKLISLLGNCNDTKTAWQGSLSFTKVYGTFLEILYAAASMQKM